MILWALLSYISPGLHFHSFIGIHTKWKCTNICWFWVYLEKFFLNLYLNLKISSSTDGYETGLSKYVTMLIYHDILKADIDIRKL